jgi:pantothenate kinase type III
MKLYTAQLPEASMSDYSGVTGRSTRECIASGVRNSISGLFEKIVNNLSQNKKVADVYITGGNAPLFLEDLNFRFNYIPELLIRGIKSVYNYNTRS